jgi:hypothetical protein
MELYLLCPSTPSCHDLHIQEELNIYIATGASIIHTGYSSTVPMVHEQYSVQI